MTSHVPLDPPDSYPGYFPTCRALRSEVPTIFAECATPPTIKCPYHVAYRNFHYCYHPNHTEIVAHSERAAG